MEQRNLSFDITMKPDQWEELGRVAADLGPGGGGFRWTEDEFGEIRVYFRDEDVPSRWRDYVTREGLYGASEREVARFHFNDGEPFADIRLPDWAEPPVVTEQEEETMQLELEQWVRGKWHELLRTGGLHYERGHIPQS